MATSVLNNSELSEIHHYTDGKGLEGILKSNHIWARPFDQLNDSSEFRHGIDVLANGLKRKFFNPNSDNQDTDRRVKQLRLALDHIISSPISPLKLRPFVASFCRHQDKRIARHGLLSQWRGYADGGYCLVFDLEEMKKLIDIENRAYPYYADLQFHSVAYGGVYDSGIEIPNIIVDYMDRFIKNDNKTTNNHLLSSLFTFIGIHKHWGFQEESELRIIAYPRTSSEESDPQPKVIHDEKRTHIKLFEKSTALPIKRIIVSPSRDQQKNIDLIKGITGNDIEITASEIPYITQA